MPAIRNLGYVLLTVLAVGLALGVAASLIGAASHRGHQVQDLRLLALDMPATPTPDGVRGAAVMRRRRSGRRVAGVHLHYRFGDAFTGTTQVGGRGIAWCRRPGGLPVGNHRFEVAVSEARPMLGVRAAGTVWVRPADVEVVCLDAAALLDSDGLPVASPARDRVRDLANAVTLVYFVLGRPEAYEVTRRRLGRGWVPPGLPYWIDPEAPRHSLRMLVRRWPGARRALVADETLRDAAAREGFHILEVPPAGEAEGGILWPDVNAILAGPSGAAGEG